MLQNIYFFLVTLCITYTGENTDQQYLFAGEIVVSIKINNIESRVNVSYHNKAIRNIMRRIHRVCDLNREISSKYSSDPE